MSHEVAVDMGVTYRPLSLADIKIRPTAADGDELRRLEDWNAKFGTFARAEPEVSLAQGGGCWELLEQPGLKILVVFILFWVGAFAVHYLR